MKPTIEEVKRVADGLGAFVDDGTDFVTFSYNELQAFAQHWHEECRKDSHVTLIQLSRDLQAIQDDGSCLCTSCAQHAMRLSGKALRNNTGE